MALPSSANNTLLRCFKPQTGATGFHRRFGSLARASLSYRPRLLVCERSMQFPDVTGRDVR